jgi:hypothetical protein
MPPVPGAAAQQPPQAGQARLEACLRPPALHLLPQYVQPQPTQQLTAHTTREWSLAGLGGDEKSVARHFVAVSTNAAEVAKFGIDTDNTFEF